MTHPRILLTNDDGIWSPGLAAMAEQLRPLGELFILAPSQEMSATGHALSIRKAQGLRPCTRDGCLIGYSFDGFPADCVKFAVAHWLEHPPHLVVSGINPGPNFGTNVPYSGTVAAAVEAAILGIPGMAVSVGNEKFEKPVEFQTAARIAAQIAQEILTNGMAPGTALNINIPLVPEEEIQGFRVVPQGRFRVRDHYTTLEKAPDGALQFSNIGAELHYTPDGEETDDWAVRHNYVAITPLWFDMTAHKQIEHWRERLEGRQEETP